MTEALAEQVTRVIMRHFDLDPDIYVGMHGGYGEWLDCAREVLSVIARPAGEPLVAALEVETELRQGKHELLRLMESIWRREYRESAPQWQPLDDLVGMVSQIDNMYAGVRGQRDAARAALRDILDTSGARGTYHALKHADAVERAEALLAHHKDTSQ